MITEIILITTNAVTFLALVACLFFNLRLSKKYHIVAAEPLRLADERFMDLLHSRRGLFIIEKIDERDVLLHRRR